LISSQVQNLPPKDTTSPEVPTKAPLFALETLSPVPVAAPNIPVQPTTMLSETVRVVQAPVEPVQVPSFDPNIIAQPPIAPSLPPAPAQTPAAPVRIEPSSLPPLAEVNEPQALRIPAVEPIAISEVPSAPLLEAVPDMWRIDASPVNMEELYATEDQVVEVVHSMDDEDTYMHGTDFEDLHPDSGVISLELHPAKAIGVNLSGIPELEETLAEGFYAIGEESWAQAAIAFQKMAAKMPGDSAVFNNYGLALLQRALTMAKSSDLEVQQLASTQFESAILALREAAKSSPANGTILLNLTHALLVSGRAEKALNLLFMYQKHNENTPESANLEAATLVSMGESGRALDVLQSVKQDVTIAANISKLTYS
jgi:thioredoxin-like negative regulator of GroEL